MPYVGRPPNPKDLNVRNSQIAQVVSNFLAGRFEFSAGPELGHSVWEALILQTHRPTTAICGLITVNWGGCAIITSSIREDHINAISSTSQITNLIAITWQEHRSLIKKEYYLLTFFGINKYIFKNMSKTLLVILKSVREEIKEKNNNKQWRFYWKGILRTILYINILRWSRFCKVPL